VNPWLLLVVPACYLATLKFLDGRYPLTQSFPSNMLFSFEWTEQIRAGIWYPRWLEHAYAGLGNPTFHFYGPLCMYAVLPFSVVLKLPLTTSILLGTTLALPVMGLGVARLTAVLCSPERRWLQGATAALAVLAPYPWIDVYVRGAMAEIWAMAILPWLLAALLESLSSRDARDRFRVVVTMALLGLCHPPVFMISTGAIAVGLLTTSSNWRDLVTAVRRCLIPMAAGVLLDAFYLASAIIDQRYVNIDVLNEGPFAQPPAHVLAGALGHLSSKMAEGFEADMVPGFLAGAVAVLWAARLIWRRGHPDGTGATRNVVFLIALALFSAFMMTDLGNGVYGLVPLLNRIQFAYRWLSVYCIATTALWGLVLLGATQPSPRGQGLSRVVAWIAVLGVATLALGTLSPRVTADEDARKGMEALFAKTQAPDDFGNPAAAPKQVGWGGGVIYADANGKLLYLDLAEYMPRGKPNRGFPPRLFAPVEWASGRGTVSNLSWRPQFRGFEADSPTGGDLLIRTAAWLGWRVDVNGARQPADRAGDEGRMRIAVPAGHSKVVVRYAGTPAQRLGNAVSLLTLLGLVGLAFLTRARPAARFDWGI
jgi:hypothetical protein